MTLRTTSFEVGLMRAPREVGSIFELAAEKVQYILKCIAQDAAREAAESGAAASTCETASVVDTLMLASSAEAEERDGE